MRFLKTRLFCFMTRRVRFVLQDTALAYVRCYFSVCVNSTVAHTTQISYKILRTTQRRGKAMMPSKMIEQISRHIVSRTSQVCMAAGVQRAG
jgi:hypothetical protein